MRAPPEPSSVRRVLILRSSALGDVVHALPALAALRQLYPLAEIDWLVEPMGAPLLAGHPDLTNVWLLPRSDWKQRFHSFRQWPGLLRDIGSLARQLRRRRYDLVVDFQANLRSAATMLLVGGRLRAGFDRSEVREFGPSLLTRLRAAPTPERLNKVEKNLAIPRRLGFRGESPRGVLVVDRADREWARGVLAKVAGRGPIVVLHPAVSRFGEIKRWPVERFATLVDRLRGHPARTLITWGPGEEELAHSIGRPTVLGESTPVGRFAALLAEADLVVAADTGALPIAAMAGTPTVGLYGPKDAAVFAPFPDPGEIVASTAPCSPCRLRRCEHRICMTLVSADAAYEAAARALSTARVRPLNEQESA